MHSVQRHTHLRPRLDRPLQRPAAHERLSVQGTSDTHKVVCTGTINALHSRPGNASAPPCPLSPVTFLAFRPCKKCQKGTTPPVIVLVVMVVVVVVVVFRAVVVAFLLAAAAAVRVIVVVLVLAAGSWGVVEHSDGGGRGHEGRASCECRCPCRVEW